MSRSPVSQRLLSTAAVLLMLAGPTLGGPIFLPGRVGEDGYEAPKAAEPADGEPATAPPTLEYEIRYSTIEANAKPMKNPAMFVTVTAEETIYGPKEPVRTVCLVPLPDSVETHSVQLRAGTTAKNRKLVEGVRVLTRAEARTFMEGVVKATGDVGFAAMIDRPIAVVDGFDLGERTNFAISFEQAASNANGIFGVTLPLPRTKWTTKPVERLSVNTSISANEPMRIVFSPTHQTKVERPSLFEAVARVRSEDITCDEDYKLHWVADEGDLGLRLLTHRMPGEDDGYFLVVANPTGRADGSDVLEKDITFVLDTSGSMRGEKIEQCRAAISYCLDNLGEGDRFNITTFGTEIGQFRREHAPNTPEHVTAAKNFVDSIVARGRTNIDGALLNALMGEGTPGRPRITIFLTDGTPTAGELVPERILEVAERANVAKSPVYVLGVGHDVNVHLLDRLAEQSEGAAEFVEPDEEIDVKVAGLYDRLAHPVLTNVSVDFGELDTHSVFPRKVPALYRNTRVMLFGRYREGGETTVTMKGMLAGVEREYSLTVTAPAKPAGNASDFVPPLWATRKIGYLLQEMRLHGEDPELLEEVVRLSKKYGIVTEYTQFVAMRANIIGDGGVALAGATYADRLGAFEAPAGELGQFGGFGGQFRGRAGGAFGNGNAFRDNIDFGRFNRNEFAKQMNGPVGGLQQAAGAPGLEFGELDDEAAVAEVTRQLALARQQETGRWAFNQAKNDKDLQSRTVATGVANSYVDRRGNKVALDAFVQHVGGRCFFLKNGQWCESEEQGERKERVVELYSKEYFALLESNDDFRRAQKLGWALSMNVGDERVVIEKEGKRSPLPEPPKPEVQDEQGAAPNVGPVPPQLQNSIQRAEPQPQINRLQQEKIDALNDVRQQIPGRRAK